MERRRNIEALKSEGIRIHLKEELELLVGPHTDDCVSINTTYPDKIIVLEKSRQQTEGWIIVDCWKDGKKWLGFLAVPPQKYSQIRDEIGYLEKIFEKGWLPTPREFYQKIQNFIMFLGDPLNKELNHY